MSNSQSDYYQSKDLEAYFKRKAEQEANQKKEKELSSYEACVLRESARVKALIAEAQAKFEGNKK